MNVLKFKLKLLRHCLHVCLKNGMKELFVGIRLKEGLFEGHECPGHLIAKTEEMPGAQTEDGSDTCQETIHYIQETSNNEDAMHIAYKYQFRRFNVYLKLVDVSKGY